MNFEATYQGQVYSLAGGIIYEYWNGLLRGTSASATVDDQTYANGKRVALTGYTVTSQKGTKAYQTKSGGYIVLSEGWKNVGTLAIAQYSQSAAQALVDKIVKNNITIVQNNLVCARFAYKFTEDQKATIRILQNRAQSRKSMLETQGLCSSIQTSYPRGYADLGGYLDALMSGESVGIATWAIVVIAAVVIAATATAAYYAYQAFAAESEQDVKYSKQLMAVLQSKLTPEEYDQLMKETQGIVTKARIKQAARSYGNVGKWVLIAIGCYAAYGFIKNTIAQRQ